MSLLGSFYVGTSGLRTSQDALNTTAHNVSNVDTSGYTRQQVLFADKTYNTVSYNAPGVSIQQVGMGVTYSETRQIRDVFLDSTYRQEAGRGAFYEVSSAALDEIEDLLGELDGTAFQTSLDNLWQSVQELSKTPESSVTQGVLVQRCAEFLERAKAVYSGMCDYQSNMNIEIKNSIDKINSYGRQILDLNDRIRKIETAGVENANDLRDERNDILDKLGALVNMSYNEDSHGAVDISIEGIPFVTCDTLYEMGAQIDSVTGFYTPFWPQNASYTENTDGTRVYDISNAQVFSFSQPISTELDTDIGSLKALILARGDHPATYADLQDANYYNDNIAQSVIMNIQSEFDQIVHSIITKINGVLSDAADPTTGYLCEEDGQPIQMFQKLGSDGYTYNTLTGNWDYAAEDVTNRDATEQLYTISNLTINQTLRNDPSLLGFVKEDGSVDQETADKLKDIFTEELYTLNPNVATKNSFMNYYSSLVAQVGNSGSVYKSLMNNQQATVAATEAERDELVGVSTDEELSNMIRFQNAYNASSRYINAVSEMLEHIINTLGS